MLVHLWWWLQHISGTDAPGSRAYNFWSGFAGDIPLFVGGISLYLHHNCHKYRCPRIGKHLWGGYCKYHKEKEN